MASNATFAEVAALAGDPARAGMLHALMDGRALTASELARVAGITPQTASTHLAPCAWRGRSKSRSRGGTAIIGWPRPRWHR
jgi:DNA-binding transcriptional ArsR family regulator